MNSATWPSPNQYIPNRHRNKCLDVVDFRSRSLSPPGAPSILKMLQRLDTRAAPVEHDHVESIALTHRPVPQDPAPRDPLEHLALAQTNGLFPTPAPVRSPSLHFHECDDICAASNQIQVTPSHAPAMRLDAPAMAGKPLPGRNFSVPAGPVSGIGPVLRGNARGGHAQKMRGGAGARGSFSRDAALQYAPRPIASTRVTCTRPVALSRSSHLSASIHWGGRGSRHHGAGR